MDETQKNFVTHGNERIRLLAPAGSGKTLAILYRCVELYTKDNSCEFLIFSFTKAAAAELKTRLNTDEYFTPIRYVTIVTTINAWGESYLKRLPDIYNPRLLSDTLSRKFAVLNNLQPVWTLERFKHIRDLLVSTNGPKNSAHLLDLMDQSKCLGINIEDFSEEKDNYIDVVQKYIKYFQSVGVSDFVEHEYWKNLSKLRLDEKTGYDEVSAVAINFFPFFVAATRTLIGMGFYTFEDQKYLPYIHLRRKNNNGTRKTVQKKIHLFVDEFQDSSPLDLYLIREIVKLHDASLTIVGDDDQSIYQFRGASSKFIVSPEDFFDGDFQTIIFETNYRSPTNIIRLSQRLIRHNNYRVQKNISSINDELAQIHFIDDEPSKIFQRVESKFCESIGSGHKVTLIGRTRGQLLPYQIICARNNITFYSDDDINIFRSDAFKKLRDALKVKIYFSPLSYSPNNVPGVRFDADGYKIHPLRSHGSSQDDVIKIINFIIRYPLNRQRQSGLRSYLRNRWTNIKDVEDLREIIDQYPHINDLFAGDLSEIVADFFSTKKVTDALDVMAKKFNGFKKDFSRSDDDVFYTDPPFTHLIDFAVQYGDKFEDFLSDLENIEFHETDEYDEKIKIHISTVFRTKGKEYDTVIVLDANDEFWPNKMAKSESELETERRLFYVAITRTKKELIFVNANRNPSPYLNEMGFDSERRCFFAAGSSTNGHVRSVD
ncbi:MAG: ATP-dependent helicase [Planctomycetaceae bacterium]|nr:ATP-dependent helicase [Planctomycetaceae bacterium]